MRVLLATGIYPPDIGGPATHASDLRDELTTRGDIVDVVTVTDEPRVVRDDGITRFPRSWPWPLRNAMLLGWIAWRARAADAVYATGLGPPAVAGARVARRPVVLKIVGDPAWERAVRRSLTTADFDEFQAGADRSPAVRAMRRLRGWTTRHASRVVTPSEHLRDTVAGWSGRDDIEVIPNGVRTVVDTRAHDMAAHHVTRSDDEPLRVLFVGRLVPWKRLELLIEAVARVPHAQLEIAGDGPEGPSLRAFAASLGTGDRVRFAGVLPHDEVMARLRAADLFGLVSSYEGLPHVVIEALVSGTPVLATRDAGVVDIIDAGTNGIVVEPTVDALAAALAHAAADRAAVRRLAEGAAASGRDWSFDRCADRVRGLLASLVDDPPRGVFVGKSAVPEPLDRDHRDKYALHHGHLETVVVCSGERLSVDRAPATRIVRVPQVGPKAVATPVFYTFAPLVALAYACGRRPAAVSCQSPYEAVMVLAARTFVPERFRPRVQIEVHGDWRTATRLYGSTARAWIAPLADRIGAWAIRRADRVRVVSDWLGALTRDTGFDGPMDRFIAYSDYRAFYDPPPEPLGDVPRVAFIGMLERYKAVDVLLDAWPLVLQAVPEARLEIVGSGSQRDDLRRRIDAAGIGPSVWMTAQVPRPEIRRVLDRSWCLCLPSRSEGLGRVIVEAMAAGRAVVASRAGGPEELVLDRQTGRLVAPDDPRDLAAALVDVLRDRSAADRMGRAGRDRALAFDPLSEYEAGIERFSTWIQAS